MIDAPLKVESMSASTCLTTGWRDELGELRGDDERWSSLIEMEIEACAEPGCVDAGPHIIAVTRKPMS